MLRLVKCFYRFLLLFSIIIGVIGKLIHSGTISDEEIEKIRSKYFEKFYN